MRRVNLYTTVGCHLCEEALALLLQAKQAGHGFDICEVEISESESLMKNYGVRIPVICFEGEADELGWPFTYAEVVTFLSPPA